jgi:hypothetical protein
MHLRWRRFEATELRDVAGTGKVEQTGSSEVVSTLVVPGRATGQGLTKTVRLYETDALTTDAELVPANREKVLAGMTRLDLALIESAGKRRRWSFRYKLEIAPGHADQAGTVCVEKRGKDEQTGKLGPPKWSKRLILKRDPGRGRSADTEAVFTSRGCYPPGKLPTD